MICYVTTGVALVGEQCFYAEVLLDCCCCGCLFLVLTAAFVLIAGNLREHLGYNGIKELDNRGVLIRLADLNEVAEDVDYSMKTKVHMKEMFARKRMTESTKGTSPTVKAKDKEKNSLLDLDIGTLYLAMLKVMLQHNTQRRRCLRSSIHKSQS